MSDKENQNENIMKLAKTNFRGQQRKFGIRQDDRRRHMYVIGKTGMGKSVFLENMAIQDIQAGRGLAFIDPHGETAQRLLDFIPADRINDVVYFNPADIEFPIAFNILESIDFQYKHLVASGLMGVFTKIWANLWSARMEYILNNCLLALLDYPGTTLLGINRLFVDKEYRKKIISHITDPVVKTFWVNEYANYNERYRTEAIAPIQNKVGQFLSSRVIRNIVGQSKSTLDMRKIMDEKKILLVDLSKGKIGEDNSALLGAMIITKIQLAAMSRADVPEEDREDFHLYVDEFQNFATESFADILSEARKYRLNLILAHQYIAQLTTKDSTKVRDSIFGNVGTLVSFRVGADDAEFLEKEFMPRFLQTDIVNLTKYDIYLKLLIDGVSSEPFSATTLPPIDKNTNSESRVIKVSRERYARPKELVENRIMRWSGLDETSKAIGKESKLGNEEEARYSKRQNASRPQNRTRSYEPREDHDRGGMDLHEAKCDECGRIVRVPFKPEQGRDLFCKNCLKKIREERNTRKTRESRQITNQGKEVSYKVPGAISLAEALSRGSANANPNPTSSVDKSKAVDEKVSISPSNSNSNSEFDSGLTLKPGKIVKLD